MRYDNASCESFMNTLKREENRESAWWRAFAGQFRVSNGPMKLTVTLGGEPQSMEFVRLDSESMASGCFGSVALLTTSTRRRA
jgi:hypothetical protein